MPLTLVSSVGRAWDCSEKTVGIPGSPVQSGTGDNYVLLFFNRKICPTVQFNQNRDGD